MLSSDKRSKIAKTTKRAVFMLIWGGTTSLQSSTAKLRRDVHFGEKCATEWFGKEQ
jgi:hypothetical protein